MLEYLETLTKWHDEGRSFNVIYCDFAKAFDKVPWERLLAKMEGLGVGGKYPWLGQKVAHWRKIPKCHSEWTTVTLGRDCLRGDPRKLLGTSTLPDIHQ